MLAGGQFFKIEIIKVLQDSLVEMRVVGVQLSVSRRVGLVIKVPKCKSSRAQLMLWACKSQLR